MKLVEKILFATDFSQAADNALQMAISVAKTFSSEIIMIHVIREPQDSPLALDRLKNAATKRFKGIQSDIKKEGIQVDEPIVAVGTPFDQIIQFAASRDVNVIIIGSGEKERGDRFRLGITAERLVRRSNKPVWVVKRGSPPLIKKILCPVDFSEPSRRALTNAIHLSRNFQADLTVLTVVEPLSSIYRAAAGALAKAEEKTWLEQEQFQFDKFLRGFDFHNLTWTKALRQGKPHQEILAMARETKCDLLVMGSEGRTGLARIFLGSVAEKVIREIPCSVITVKSEHAVRLKLGAEIATIDTHFKEGKELLEKGFPVEALRQFEIVIDMDKMYAPAWEGLAAAHSRLGHEEESKKCKEVARHIRQTLWQHRVEAEIRARHRLRGKKS